jgi:predicted O-methyltransferase YrrM
MSSQILSFIAGTKPLFNADYAILSAPVRHIFMMASIWHLTKDQKRDDFKILEVGSWVGASALSFAQGLTHHNNSKGTITCVDAWKPFFDREKHHGDGYQVMEQALGTETAYQLFSHNVSTLPSEITCQHLRGQSENILPLLRSDTFDIIFIDADHNYTPVLRDIKNSLDLVKDGGIICGDDLNLQLHEVDKDLALRHAEEDFIKDPKTNRNYHPGVTLAVAEIFGEVSSWGGFWAMQKQGSSWKKISLKGMPVHYPKHFPESALKKAEDHVNDIVVA